MQYDRHDVLEPGWHSVAFQPARPKWWPSEQFGKIWWNHWRQDLAPSGHGSWIMRQSRQSMTAFLERKRLKSRSNVTTPCKISSEKPVLASVSLWHMQGHDQIALENWKQRWLNICFFLCLWCVLHDDGFLMVFAASLKLMICTATICNSLGDVLGGDSMGFPSFWTTPGSCAWSSAGTEFLREIATLRDEARVRGDPEKFLGQGSLDHSLSTGASFFALGMVKPTRPFWSHLGMVYCNYPLVI